MNGVQSITVSYGPRKSRLQKWRETELAHSKMMTGFSEAEAIWKRVGQDIDDRRLVCTATLCAAITFVRSMGMPTFASGRLHELAMALGEANAGHKTPLINRSRLHPGYYSPCDLIYQGAAQTCVDLLTSARIPVGEARTRVARLFHLKKVKGFSVPTLAKLGSRLAGRGSQADRAYDYYGMMTEFADQEIARRGAARPLSDSLAWNVAKMVIVKAIAEDQVPK